MNVTMVGRLDPCCLVTYGLDPDVAAGLLPAGLEPQVVDGKALWGIVASRVVKMRPRGAPRLLGSTYVHVAHRIYAQATDAKGTQHQGLHFLRSDVDQFLMALMGNRMTDFRFHRSKVHLHEDKAGLDLAVAGVPDADGRLRIRHARPKRPGLVPKYAPWGLSTARGGKVLKLAEVRRDEAAWREEPVTVEESRWGLLDRLAPGAKLLGATRVAPIDYVWRIGERVRLA
jgi:uncharacterized protein YqjF (DUF2071 family)